jgi:lincosamide and streptogramin A transport system ATP-binding/permease protein
MSGMHRLSLLHEVKAYLDNKYKPQGYNVGWNVGGQEIFHAHLHVIPRYESELKISYVSQDSSHLKGNLTNYAIDNHIDESLFKDILRKIDFSRIQFEKDMTSFNGGQKKKVLIAKSLFEKTHLHIWDEPLNFIDVISRMQIEELLLEYSIGILAHVDAEGCSS